MDGERLLADCLNLGEDIKTFVFGGNDPIGYNWHITDRIVKELRKYDSEIRIHIQTGDISHERFKRIEIISPDKVYLTLNGIGENKRQYVNRLIRAIPTVPKVIYIPGKTEFLEGYENVIVQQYQNEDVLDETYAQISIPKRDEVLKFAESVGAKGIITKECGYEELDDLLY
jgi:hypothetical protein